ncbi:hypothetical protein [Denitromonas sp.]|uniref:hypothetical protein n=1 Tax=Denitromonas sp. TaxID=2734609 RepID=UPI002AFFB7DB|nr:hypothetical protein [Denitromonas sp.]
MDPIVLILLAGIAAYTLKTQDQRRRITLLGTQLQHYSLEKHIETLIEGYLRALGEDDADRREQIWGLMRANETALGEQLERLARDIAKLDAEATRVSKLAWAIPFADKLFPAATFDLRQAIDIHARGVAQAIAEQPGRSEKDKAFTVMAEMYLFQHTCHWFCRSKNVASARLLARHRTAYAQVLAAVTPDTRRAYEALVGKV